MDDFARRIFLELEFPSSDHLGVLELSAFLYDLNRLYVVAFKTEEDPFELDVDSVRGYGRNSFRIAKEYQLEVSSVRFQSPGLLILSTAFAAIAAVWTTLQIIEKVKLWPLQKEKLELEVSKLRHEHQLRLSSGGDYIVAISRRFSAREDVESGARRLRKRGERQRIEPILTIPAARGAIRQLSKNPLKPAKLTVEIPPDNSEALY
jgi:hypothetical protein